MLVFTYDPRKDAINRANHGLSLGQAAHIEWDAAWIHEQTHRDEVRMLAYAPIGVRLMACVYVDRPADAPTERRVISLRKANQREVKAYEQATA